MTKISFGSLLFALAFSCMLQPLGMDIFVSEIPRMMRDLQVNANEVQYILTSFMLATGSMQLIVGFFTNRFGCRITIIMATVLFAIASMLCVLYNDIAWLTAIRFIQGTAAAACVVVVFTATSMLLDAKNGARMFSFIGAVLAITPMLAPLLGVFLTEALNTWHAMFYFLSVFAIGCSVYNYFKFPIIAAAQPESNEPSFKKLIAILNDQAFLTYTFSGTMAMTALFLYFSVGSIIIIDVLGLSAITYSYLFAVNALVYMCGNYLASILLKGEMGLRQIVCLGNIMVMLASLVMIALQLTYGTTALLLVIANGLITFGVGLTIGSATSGALTGQKKHAGIAGGLYGTIQYSGAAFIVFLVTRFPIDNMYLIGVPMFIFVCVNLILLMKLDKDSRKVVYVCNKYIAETRTNEI